MTWLLGLIGWGGGAALVAALALGMVLSRRALFIAAAVVAVALLAWGWRGYVQASALRADLSHTQAALDKTTGERDKARSERAAALDAAEACSRSVEALKQAADEREAENAHARQQAAGKAHQHRQKANEIMATPASVPGDDAASAQDRIWKWLENRP